ncbi:MAG: DUF748 domain-containing protein, partial [Cellvibrionaceae bacterium]|nr:DUF748 domain-containing protein [Cellvibrionaceae bacterium]
KFIDKSQVKLAHAEFDYLDGYFKLKGVSFQQGQGQPLAIEQITLKLDPKALLNRHLKISQLHIQGGVVPLQQSDGQWQLAGLPLTAGNDEASKTEPGPPWRISLKQLQLDQVKLNLEHPQLIGALLVKQLIAADYDSRAPALNLSISHHLELQSSQLQISPEQWLHSKSPSQLKGQVQLRAPLNKLMEEFELQLATRIDNIELQLGDRQKPMALANLQSLELKALSLKSLSEPSLKAHGISAQQLQFLPGAISVKDQASASSAVNTETIELDSLSFGAQTLSLGKLAINGVQAHIELVENYQWQALQPLLQQFPASPAKQQGGTATEATAIELQALALSNSQIHLQDHNIEPKVTLAIKLQQLDAGPYHSQKPEQATQIKLAAGLQEIGRLSFSGSLSPLAGPQTIDGEYELQHFNLVDISPYFEQQSGYFIRTGQLNLKGNTKLVDKQLNSQNKIRLNAIELDRVDEERAKKLDQQVSMPLDSALGLLRNDKGDIKLDMPIEGNIDELEFGTGDIVNQLSARAVKSASLAYLKYAFQPYGSLITVGSWLSDQAQKIRLDPIEFDAGQSQLNQTQLAYIDKLGKLLQDKQKLRIKACPIASPNETAWLQQQAQQANAEQAPPPIEEQIQTLQKQRLDGLQKQLLEQYQ